MKDKKEITTMKTKSYLPVVSTLSPSRSRFLYLKRELEELSLILMDHPRKETQELFDKLEKEFQELKKNQK